MLCVCGELDNSPDRDCRPNYHSFHTTVTNSLNPFASTLKFCGLPLSLQREINKLMPALPTTYSLLSPWRRRFN